jgi:thiamine biosynthesis lipoprotein
MTEEQDQFACFGSTCAVFVIGDTPERSAREAVAFAKGFLLDWHDRFTRFEPDSELSRLNADPREVVPVSDAMLRFAEAVVAAARLTGGLVDATLLREVEAAGYRHDLGPSPEPANAPEPPPARRPAGPSSQASWREIVVDRAEHTISRPPGVYLDSGGLAKGLAADALASVLGAHASFAIEAAGDMHVGGAARMPRPVQVASPLGGDVLHTFALTDAGVATSGITRRSWVAADGTPAHHLLDPATGRPAFTGITQVTALAPTATEAEARAKAAVLSGPEGARGWLPHGGVVVLDDGELIVLEPAAGLDR